MPGNGILVTMRYTLAKRYSTIFRRPGVSRLGALKSRSTSWSWAIDALSFRQRVVLLVALFVVVVSVVLMLEPVPQDPNYHRFADSRSFLQIPNFNDVVSNLGFALAGVIGVLVVLGRTRSDSFAHPTDARPYLIFFVGIALVSVGSAYYHLAPSNERLFWDRLPMSVAFMSISAAIVADRIDGRAGNGWLLLVMVAAGAGSLIYWHWTESRGLGDLRFYALVQFYPMFALPLIIGLFPRFRYTAGRYVAWMVLWYAMAKLFEYLDTEIFELLGYTVSGHTLKHLAAAMVPIVIARMLLYQRLAPDAGLREDAATVRTTSAAADRTSRGQVR
jgi:hypothetical protein